MAQFGLDPDTRLVMNHPWTADANSSIEAFTSPFDTATISGAAFASSGTIDVLSGTLVIEPTFDATAATITVGFESDLGVEIPAVLQLDGTATLGSLLLEPIGQHAANLIVNGNTTIPIRCLTGILPSPT